MEFIDYSNSDIFNTKIKIEMTIADFINLYASVLCVYPKDFCSYIEEKFPNFDEKTRTKLYTGVCSQEMEKIIDELGIPHKKWYAE